MSWGVATQNGVSVSIASIVSLSSGATEFSPYDLFTGGAKGAWYDPSDYSTLFQDSAGTTPVTAVEQPVGLMLDKSQGLVLGSELITPEANRDFSSDTGYWTKSTGVTISGGACSFTNVSSGNGLYKSSFVTASTYYEVTFTVTSYTSGSLRVYFGGNRGATVSATGTYTQRVQSGTADTFIVFESQAANTTLSIDDVSVKRVTGNHASQATTASRPVLRARYNLLTYSEQFNNGVWSTAALNAFGSGSVVDTTATLDPIGGNTAEFIQENTSASTTHGLTASVTLIANTTYTITCVFKAATRTLAIIGIDSAGGNGARAFFNLSTGAVGTASALGTGTLVSAPTPTSLGNGWYRCQLTAKVDPAATSASLRLSIAETDGVQTYTGNGTSGIYIWGADLRTGSSAGTYQRIAAATDYATAGFAPYLAPDGVDDFIGAAYVQSAYPLTIAVGMNNDTTSATRGVVSVAQSDSQYKQLRDLGPTGSDANDRNATDIPSPQINVSGNKFVLAQFETSLVTHQVNGGTATTIANTNAFGTSANIFVGKTRPAGLFSPARNYGVVVIDAVLTAAQKDSLKNWMAAKMGVTL